MVVFQSNGMFGSLNSDDGAELFSIPPTGGAIIQIVDDDDGFYKNPDVSADGVWVVWHSASEFDGANPEGRVQVFRGRTDGTFVEILTTNPDYGAADPDVTADGNRVVYVSGADPLGTNQEHNVEVFLLDKTTGITQQLTATAEGRAEYPQISDDGEMVRTREDTGRPEVGRRGPGYRRGKRRGRPET